MTAWETLEIEPTDNLTAIKKAYAKGLKKHHPEEDPEGYQQLREAYDFAMKQAKQGIVHTATKTAEPLQDWALDEKTVIPEHPVDEFIKKVQNLYDDFFARLEIDNWETLLQADIIWNVKHSEQLQDELIDFLQEHPYLPSSVWQLLEQTFHWSEQKEQLQERYGEETTSFLIENIAHYQQLGYDCFQKEVDIDYERYLQLRADAQAYLRNDQLEAAKAAIDRAFQLFARDPDLWHLKGVYYLRNNDYRAALHMFQEKLALSPADPDGLLYSAQLHFHFKDFQSVIADCDQLLAYHEHHVEGLFLKIKGHLELNDEVTAHQWIEKAIELHPDRPEFFPYRSRVLNEKTRNEQIELPEPTSKKKRRLNNMLFYLFMVLRRAWIYVFVFLIMLIPPIPFHYTALFLIPILWEFGRVALVFLKPAGMFKKTKKRRQALYFRCLSAACIESDFLNHYFTVYDFTYVRDRLIGKKFLQKVLEKWEVSSAAELKQRIQWLMDVGTRREFDYYLDQLTPLSEEARTRFVQSLTKDDPDYPKFFIANRGIHTLTEAGVAAVDWAWSIYLCRVGRRLGWLSKTEANEIMLKAAQQSQQAYLNWNEYFTAFHLGSYFNADDIEHDQYAKHGLSIIFTLLIQGNSPLLKLDWKNEELVHK
ncbi:DUF1266 domain-containing protein [Shouchella clausii]|uniref:J domain-containing protein n=2 Tax=Bacillaceae TaxID=186817 RepID=A0A268NYL2_SHOCL|nr:DUF1266 domain-containing protein [Shouchella clausii]PAE88593.1 hypothetical protein CHH72_13210 [Shouchella clausii]